MLRKKGKDMPVKELTFINANEDERSALQEMEEALN
jgi:hypothetical protein